MAFKGFSKHFTILSKIEDFVQKEYPHEYKDFKYYKIDLMFKLEYLELIHLRYEEDKKNWEQTAERMEKFIEDVKSNSLSQQALQQESEVLGEKSVQYSRLLMIDIDSFYIFANILLDRIPFLLKPLYKNRVIKTDIEIECFDNFRKHVNWFIKHPDSIIDVKFRDRLLSYGSWFFENLRNPRNQIITHPCWSFFLDEIDFKGNMKRIRKLISVNEKRKVKEETMFSDISILFRKIIEFLEFLDGYFAVNLSPNKQQTI